MSTRTTRTPEPFRFDGYGITDAEWQRICKVTSCEPYVYPEGTPVRNVEFDRLSNLFAASADLLLAAKDALRSLRRLPDVNGAYRVTCIGKLVNAIAKAEGTNA